MRLLIAAMMCFPVLASCSGQPSRAFSAVGIDERSVIMGTLLDQDGGHRLNLPKEDVGLIIEEMRKIQPARTAVVEPRFVVGLFTGSSLQNQKVELFIDVTGEGYFRHGNHQPVMFYSPTLYGTLNTIETKANKAVEDNLTR